VKLVRCDDIPKGAWFKRRTPEKPKKPEEQGEPVVILDTPEKVKPETTEEHSEESVVE
jgi:hypothetical protein